MLWARRTPAGWIVSADNVADGSDEDAIVLKRPYHYIVDGYGGARVSKTKPAWYCLQCQVFDCPHTFVVNAEDSERRAYA